VPVLAEASRLEETLGGVRRAILLRSLRVSRPSLDRTLAHLRERALLAPNEGYGHPLRPELRLTAAGRPVALWCGLYVAVVEKLGGGDVFYRKWTAPVVEAVRAAGGRARFSAIEAALDDVSPRALALALKALTAGGLLRREIGKGYPPSARYALTAPARRLAKVTVRFPG